MPPGRPGPVAGDLSLVFAGAPDANILAYTDADLIAHADAFPHAELDADLAASASRAAPTTGGSG